MAKIAEYKFTIIEDDGQILRTTPRVLDVGHVGDNRSIVLKFERPENRLTDELSLHFESDGKHYSESIGTQNEYELKNGLTANTILWMMPEFSWDGGRTRASDKVQLKMDRRVPSGEAPPEWPKPVLEAPTDGLVYGRKNAEWVEVSSSASNASKKMYVGVDADGVRIVQRYNHEYDMRVYYTFRGINRLMEFENVYLVPVTSTCISTDLTGGTMFWENSSDSFSPYSIRTTAEGGGDFDWIFTGGNHGTDGNAGGQPTARCEAFRVYVDGVAYEEYEGYADRVEVVWTNVVKAMNTVKTDGSGRDVVRETYRLYFDGYDYKVTNRIEILEAVNIYSYFGLAFTIAHYALPTWKGDVFFKSAQNTLKKAWNVAADSGGKRCESVLFLRDGHVLEFGIDPTKGLGIQEQNTPDTAVMARNPGGGKIYFDLVKDCFDIPASTLYTFEGLFRFSFED